MFGQFLIISRSQRKLDEREAIENFEFVEYPKSLFVENKVLLCTDKSDVARELYSVSQNSFHQMAYRLDIKQEEVDHEWIPNSGTVSMESQGTESSAVHRKPYTEKEEVACKTLDPDVCETMESPTATPSLDEPKK